MTLYHVNADDWDGEPHGNDLWVRADSPDHAVAEWVSYYGCDNGELPDSVDEVPEHPVMGAIPWASVPQVWINPARRIPI